MFASVSALRDSKERGGSNADAGSGCRNPAYRQSLDAKSTAGLDEVATPGEKTAMSPGNFVFDARQQHRRGVGVARVFAGCDEVTQELPIVNVAEQILGPPEMPQGTFRVRDWPCFVRNLGGIAQLLDGDARMMKPVREVHARGIPQRVECTLATIGDPRTQPVTPASGPQVIIERMRRRDRKC